MQILNCRVDSTTMPSALDFIARAIAAPGDACQQIITLNAEGIYLAQEDTQLRSIIDEAALVTPDGTGVVWASQQLGQPLPERVTGIDLMQAACERAAAEGWRIYLLGAAPGVAEQAAARLRERYPSLQIAGLRDGYFRGEEEAVLQALREAKADLLFAALGMPFQEKFLHAHKAELGVPVAIGVGGSFDVIAGNIKRAPRLMQRLRLEWLWRLLRQPSRLPRMLVLPRFMRLVKKQARQQNK